MLRFARYLFIWLGLQFRISFDLENNIYCAWIFMRSTPLAATRRRPSITIKWCLLWFFFQHSRLLYLRFHCTYCSFRFITRRCVVALACFFIYFVWFHSVFSNELSCGDLSAVFFPADLRALLLLQITRQSAQLRPAQW